MGDAGERIHGELEDISSVKYGDVVYVKVAVPNSLEGLGLRAWRLAPSDEAASVHLTTHSVDPTCRLRVGDQRPGERKTACAVLVHSCTVTPSAFSHTPLTKNTPGTRHHPTVRMRPGDNRERGVSRSLSMLALPHISNVRTIPLSQSQNIRIDDKRAPDILFTSYDYMDLTTMVSSTWSRQLL